jgi:NAD(P)H-hydrate epimerase
MYLTREEMRSLDRQAIQEFGIPGLVLMENAGRGIAELLRSLGIHGPVAVCCGKGNNGGDGFVIARHLHNWGISVRVMLLVPPEQLTGDAAINYKIMDKAGLTIRRYRVTPLDLTGLRRELSGVEWIVDALFGTGLSGPVRHPFNEVIDAINAGPARVLAADIPSGLDCDSGQPLGSAVRAHHTATLCALKIGFAKPAAESWLGEVHLIDIGVPPALFERFSPRASAMVRDGMD